MRCDINELESDPFVLIRFVTDKLVPQILSRPPRQKERNRGKRKQQKKYNTCESMERRGDGDEPAGNRPNMLSQGV